MNQADLEGSPERAPSQGKLAKVAQVVSVSPRTWTDDADLEAGAQDAKAKNAKGWPLLLLAYQSVGVIFGGVGTSPLYTFPNVFSRTPMADDVLGATCLMLWTLTIIMVVKYILVVMHANDDGEGGTFAMYSLLCRHANITPYGQTHHTDTNLSRYSMSVRTPRGTKVRKLGLSERWGIRLARALQHRRDLQQALLILVLAGTGMVLGDGVLTPAASVMSAMAGLRVAQPTLSNNVVVGVSCAILVCLFSVQRFGTAKIAQVFSPVLIVFLITNAVVSAYNIAAYMPGVFKCLSPRYGIQFFINNHKSGWIALGGIVLAITGSEAMFADMGHFSHRAITIATFALVYPSLLVIYLGEAAFLATHLDTYAQSYYQAIPKPIFWPMFVIATLAALVGSQSLISSAFSIIRQAGSLHCFPRVKVVHTGTSVEGQIYIPEVNWMLCLLAVAAVLGFRDVNAIGFAFGVTVVAVMLITTVLTVLVMLIVWHTHLAWIVAICGSLFFIEGVYLSSVLFKVPRGGWFPLAMAAVLLFISYVWHWGSANKLAVSQHTQHQLLESLLTLAPEGGSSSGEQPPGSLQSAATGRLVNRSPGLALYYSESLSSLPSSFIKLLRSVSSVHQANIFLTIRQVPMPSVLPSERYLVRNMSLPGFYRVICRFGYRDQVDQGPGFTKELVQKVAEYMRFKALHAKWSAADIYDEPFQLSKDQEKDGQRAGKASHLQSWPVLPHILPTMSEGIEPPQPPAVPLDDVLEVRVMYRA
ncbi:hypothetical protein WJX72_002281 [[Myrmecia] bisecta]|uniref:Potassium transporter n=1 Tax=[Myrmecia] bisecta TaxID=41462 RepID=A0AAW1R699_9CHLO